MKIIVENADKLVRRELIELRSKWIKNNRLISITYSHNKETDEEICIYELKGEENEDKPVV